MSGAIEALPAEETTTPEVWIRWRIGYGGPWSSWHRIEVGARDTFCGWRLVDSWTKETTTARPKNPCRSCEAGLHSEVVKELRNGWVAWP